jgi:hypothetical protein
MATTKNNGTAYFHYPKTQTPGIYEWGILFENKYNIFRFGPVVFLTKPIV